MTLAHVLAALPGWIPDLVGIAGSVVLLLILLALGGVVYRLMTGGIEWPDEEESVSPGDEDDEWDFY